MSADRSEPDPTQDMQQPGQHRGAGADTSESEGGNRSLIRDDLTGEQLTELAAFRDASCVSLYLPTHSVGRETRQDPTRLKNLLRDAWTQAEAQGLPKREFGAVVGPAEALLKDAAQLGRVAELVVAMDVACWGRPVTGGQGQGQVHDERQPGDVDLLDAAAGAALTHGGRVLARPRDELPDKQQVVALLRY